MSIYYGQQVGSLAVPTKSAVEILYSLVEIQKSLAAKRCQGSDVDVYSWVSFRQASPNSCRVLQETMVQMDCMA